MDNNTENNENYLTGRKGKITALIFLLIMLAPICYAFFKELKLSKSAKQQTTQTVNKQP